MEGTATVMASPTPDPYNDAVHSARHASPPAGQPGPAPDLPGTWPQPATQPREATSHSWRPAPTSTGADGVPSAGQSEPAAWGTVHAPSPTADAYGPPR